MRIVHAIFLTSLALAGLSAVWLEMRSHRR
jgi:hypothetical protein